MMPDPASCLALLRAGTRDAHASIETVPMLARLLSPTLTQDEYVLVLQHLHAFHAHMEPAVASELLSWPEAAAMLDGSRPRALAEDLEWFGAPAIAPPPLPQPDGTYAAVGALYVIEGSGLGGRVIARSLTESLGVSAGAGGSFYCRLDAEAARKRWMRLCELLESVSSEGESAASLQAVASSIVAGARATFRCLESWLRTIDILPQQPPTAVLAKAVVS